MWLTLEQVATAALDCRAFPLASSILKQVRDKFPESLRAARLMVRCPAARSTLVLVLRSAPATYHSECDCCMMAPILMAIVSRLHSGDVSRGAREL